MKKFKEALDQIQPLNLDPQAKTFTHPGVKNYTNGTQSAAVRPLSASDSSLCGRANTSRF